MIKYGTVNKGLFGTTLFLTFAASVISIIYPQIVKLFLDLIQNGVTTGNYSISGTNFWWYLALYGVVLLSETFINLGNDYVNERWYFKARNYICMSIFNHVQELSLDYFEKNPSGKIKERMDKGIEGIVDILEDFFLNILPQIFFVIIAGYLLFRINIIFGVIMVIGIPSFIAISLAYAKGLDKSQITFRKNEEAASAIAFETITNIRTVKSFATEKTHSRNVKGKLDNSLKIVMQRMREIVQMRFWRTNVSDIAETSIFAIGAYLAVRGDITIGTLYLAWNYSSRCFYPLNRVMRSYDDIRRKLIGISLMFDLLDTKPDIEDRKGAKLLRNVKGEVKIEDIHFKYMKREVLRGIDLLVKPGQILALVGRSGMGKSTIVKLLLRFYDPTSGNILIDGKNIADVTQKSLRQNIGVVMQDSVLFNDTVLSNIAYGKTGYTKEDVIKAAKGANAHNFIMGLPDGYDTIIGEKGVKLSGGEQQRINIARVILKNPPIVILDEATSSLDTETEQLIQEALWRMLKNKTAIVIAHRLSTVMKADLIAVLDKGKVIELDTHDQLLRKKGLYEKLFSMQSGAYDKKGYTLRSR